jgi:two-component system KDP operon response regulator KdpE
MSHYGECILVVEDDAQIRNFICYSLQSEGYKHITAKTAQSALNSLVSEQIDLMLLDLGLPDFDGTEVIRKVREWSEMPIIVVSARDQDKEKANALDIGADDYLTKPFSVPELLARIRVILRHITNEKNQLETSSTIYHIKDLTIDTDKHRVWLRWILSYLSS